MSIRTCTRFYCDKVKARLCCADCRRRCANRCANDPSRCKLVEEPAPPPPAYGNKAASGTGALTRPVPSGSMIRG